MLMLMLLCNAFLLNEAKHQSGMINARSSIELHVQSAIIREPTACSSFGKRVYRGLSEIGHGLEIAEKFLCLVSGSCSTC